MLSTHTIFYFVHFTFVTISAAIDNFLTNEMPHLKDQQNQLDNLEVAIELREADLVSQASKNMVSKEKYDQVVALLTRTQEDLARTEQDLKGARQFMRTVGSQLIGEAGAGAAAEEKEEQKKREASFQVVSVAHTLPFRLCCMSLSTSECLIFLVSAVSQALPVSVCGKVCVF
jgi:hypothetical protein